MNAIGTGHVNHERQAYLDAWRGLAALQVVLIHFVAAFYPYFLFGEQDSYRQLAAWEPAFFHFPLRFLAAGQADVCIFFILSGYVLSYRWLGSADHSAMPILRAGLRRPIRLAGVLLFSILLGGVLWKAGLMSNTEVAQLSGADPWFSRWWVEDLQTSRWLWDMTTSAFSNGVFYDPPLWTLKYELYGSFMVFAFLLVFGRWRWRVPVLLALLWVFAGSLYQGFLLGIIVADLVKNYASGFFSRPGRLLCWMTGLLGMFFCSYPHFLAPEQLAHTVYAYLPPLEFIGGGYCMLGGLLFLLFLSMSAGVKRVFSDSPTLQFLGRISYATYALHFIVLGSLSSWIFLRLEPSVGYDLAAALTVLLSVPVVVGGAHLVTLYVDTPCIRLGHKVAATIKAVQARLGAADRPPADSLVVDRQRP